MSSLSRKPITVSRVESAMSYDYSNYRDRMSRHKRPAAKFVRLAAAYAVIYEGQSIPDTEFCEKLGCKVEALWRVLAPLKRAGMSIYRSKGIVHIEDASLREQA